MIITHDMSQLHTTQRRSQSLPPSSSPRMADDALSYASPGSKSSEATAATGLSQPPVTASSQAKVSPAAALLRAHEAQDGELTALANDFWEASLRRDPLRATQLGDRRYVDNLEDLSPKAQGAWKQTLQDLYARTVSLDVSLLDESRQLTHAILRETLENGLVMLVGQHALWNVDQLDGFQVTLPDVASFQPVDTLADVEAYSRRLRCLGAFVDQHLVNLREGIAVGLTAPRVCVELVIAQLDGLIDTAPSESPYLSIMARLEKLTDAEKATAKQGIEAAVESVVLPAMRSYRDFLRDTYLPTARAEVGLSALQVGEAYYTSLIKNYTDEARDPAVIMRTGKEELAKLHARMNALAAKAGHTSWQAYADALQETHFETREAIVERSRDAVTRAQTAMPAVFGLEPAAELEIRAVEPYREADAPAAFYYEPAEDGSRPGIFYVTTYQPEKQAVFNAETTAFHEALPGHHLQISIAQGQKGLPAFQRNADFTAYIEGWALYAECLADELKLFSSDGDVFGMLNMQAFRACRLVVDTGMHAFGWSREEAIAFMQANVAMAEAEITSEVNRYIILPGQALSYMTGRMEIENLRQLAQDKLGDTFNLRDFHDHVLECGALPLPLLRQRMVRWIDAQQKATF